MTHQRNHRISDWLYHTAFFTRLYGRVAGSFAVDILWDDFLSTFLNRIPDGATLIEVGAGPGILAIRILKSRPSLKIIVTDFSPRMLELATANLAKASREDNKINMRRSQLEYVQANAMDLSKFANRQIDGIYAMGAIKHFPDPLRCLYQARNVLAGGGIMYFTDSCADGTYSGTKAIVAKLNLPPIMGCLMSPIIHLGLSREAPSRAEVESWVSEFDCDRGLELAFARGGSIFTLVYQKA